MWTFHDTPTPEEQERHGRMLDARDDEDARRAATAQVIGPTVRFDFPCPHCGSALPVQVTRDALFLSVLADPKPCACARGEADLDALYDEVLRAYEARS